MGTADLLNTRGFTNEKLLAALASVNTGFGTPEMGIIAGKQYVIYKNVSEGFDVYARAEGSAIIMGKSSNLPVSSFGPPAGTSSDAEAAADKAVSELSEIIKQLETSSTAAESSTPVPDSAANDNSMSYYMEQKLFSMKPIYEVYAPDKTLVYHVEGDVPHINYSVQKNGVEVMKLKKKMASLMLNYSIILNGNEIGQLKQKLKLSRPEIVGTLNGVELKIAADVLVYDFKITLGGREIGKVVEDYLSPLDNYSISIYDESCRDLLITLAVICDHLYDRSKEH